VGIGYGTCQRVLTKELGIHCGAAKFVPRVHTTDQQQQQQQRVDAVSGETQNDCHPHPPYFPDLAPSNFFLLLKIKLKLKGPRFGTIKEIQAESQIVLDTLKEKDFQETFQTWRRRWEWCLHAGGNYFEVDGGR
jgi:hypothetical protein